MDKLSSTITIALGLASLLTIGINIGYNWRTMTALRKTVHELNTWKQGLFDTLDVRFIRKEMFDEKLNNIANDVAEIKNHMERRRR